MRVPQFWRLRQINYRLAGQVCPRCGCKIVPPRGVCPECHPSACELTLDLVQPALIPCPEELLPERAREPLPVLRSEPRT